MYVTNSDITNNGMYGIKLDVLSSTPVGSQPYGHLNNISGNGGGANKSQLWTTYWLADSDWTNNYWGASGVVPCPWAPSHVFPYHISYGSPNPYDVPPAPGPVAYGTFQRFIPPITIEYCGADAVKDVPFSSEPFDNTVFTTPRFTLFLDVDGNFGTSSPSSDDGLYVPGSDLASGVSVPLPQSVELIAAYIDGNGAIVPPPAAGQLTFTLTETSAFTGIAMNASDAMRPDTAPDFELQATAANFGTDNTARVYLDCWDYGGFTRVNVTHGIATAEFRLPQDDVPSGGDWLPDAGWVVMGQNVNAANPDDDGEAGPGATIGDGLSAFEEFRGFMVEGSHIRLSPEAKDAFLTIMTLELRIGYGNNLDGVSVYTHEIRGGAAFGANQQEMSADRVINGNRANANGAAIAGTDQRAVLLVREVGWKNGVFGITCWIGHTPDECTYDQEPASPSPDQLIPNTTKNVRIWPDTHSAQLGDFDECSALTHIPPNAPCPYTPEQIDNEMFRTMGHEVGHSISICHRGQCPVDTSGIPPSIMTGAFMEGPPAEQPGAQYDAFDASQIRLR
ncbi:MAG TPA: hypothetical protein VLK65_13810 [Vicinamibacteria bacterium]|nr:hypothetical protein [Vicinamibacteria bacterium]